jgi:hypothetical protein
LPAGLKWKSAKDAMPDGREEREERRIRIEQEKQEERDDRIDLHETDPWEPERVDS